MNQIIYEDVDGFQFVDEFEKLFPEHYEELCVTKEFPYEPDYAAYKRCAEAGMLRCITCRADGELVGYIIFFVSINILFYFNHYYIFNNNIIIKKYIISK